MLDAIIIGGGPAGLSAALVLARCRRTALVLDAGSPRNQRARSIHNFLTRDGVRPEAFLERARRELLGYGARVLPARVHTARRLDDAAFEVEYRPLPAAADNKPPHLARARKIILATGVRDVLPDLPGFDRYYGIAIHHCPYCDGWEHRDQRLIAYGRGDQAIGLGLALLTWSPHVTACTDGENPGERLLAQARANNLPIRTDRVRAFEGDPERLLRLTFASGPPTECDAVFFNTGQVVRAEAIARALGCRFRDDGGIITTDRQCAGVRGVYVVGDADKDVQFVVVAAAEGASAAVAINRELQDEDRHAAPAAHRQHEPGRPV